MISFQTKLENILNNTPKEKDKMYLYFLDDYRCFIKEYKRLRFPQVNMFFYFSLKLFNRYWAAEKKESII